jgi:hypothetical protein
MAKKDPVRGMQPTDEYFKDSSDRSTLNKALENAGSAALAGTVVGVPAYMLGKSRGKASTKKDEDTKSGMALEIENKKKDELNKREAEGAAKEVKRNMSTFGFKNGGSASARADGIAQRGKTRGKIC